MIDTPSPEHHRLDLAWAAAGCLTMSWQLSTRHQPGSPRECSRTPPEAGGPNVLVSRKVTALDVLVRQLRNPLLVFLLGAAGVAAATGDVTDGVIIAAIVVLSVGLGFFSEYRSEVAAAALHDNIRHDATA